MEDFRSYSQFGQDRHLLEKVYPNKHDGFFVDVGAWDGVVDSNTYALEKDGWTGICVEPHMGAYEKLSAVRECTCINDALFSVPGKRVVFWERDCWSGIDETLDTHARAARDGTRRELSTRTLGNVLAECGAPGFIEYLSLDTEGSELKILEGLDLGKWTFGYITVEHNNEPGKRRAIADRLKASGYVHARENEVDDDWVHSCIADVVLNRMRRK